MYNLVADIGNTMAKTAVFSGSKIVNIKRGSYTEILPHISKWKQEYPLLKNAIICTVINEQNEISNLIQNHFHTLLVSTDINLPFKNLYKSNTLGNDRIALAAAAIEKYPNENILVIDMGTCITYDLINNKKQYLGGIISPGVQMRINSFEKFTQKLPLIKLPKKLNSIIGQTTEKCMQIGIITGIQKELEGFIQNYETQFKDLKTILTGGNSKLFTKYIKKPIFADCNFLLYGLNCILKYNLGK